MKCYNNEHIQLNTIPALEISEEPGTDLVKELDYQDYDDDGA
jgi:hypothetical protein